VNVFFETRCNDDDDDDDDVGGVSGQVISVPHQHARGCGFKSGRCQRWRNYLWIFVIFAVSIAIWLFTLCYVMFGCRLAFCSVSDQCCLVGCHCNCTL